MDDENAIGTGENLTVLEALVSGQRFSGSEIPFGRNHRAPKMIHRSYQDETSAMAAFFGGTHVGTRLNFHCPQKLQK
jgi:hypothetical protein